MSAQSPLRPFRLSLCAAAAAGLAIAAPAMPAHAQPYYGYDNGYNGYDSGASDDITVYASPWAGRSPTGAPYEVVRASRVVSYADLDLNTRWGADELRARVVRAARDACDELENGIAITAPDDPPCVSRAVRRALYQAPLPDYFRDEY